VELVGFRAEFPRADESWRDALRRLRPPIAMIDCTYPAAADESILGPALMIGTRLFLFGSSRETEAFKAIARQHGIGLVVLPRDVESLAQILSQRDMPSVRRQRD
jgi:hypothetical protein